MKNFPVLIVVCGSLPRRSFTRGEDPLAHIEPQPCSLCLPGLDAVNIVLHLSVAASIFKFTLPSHACPYLHTINVEILPVTCPADMSPVSMAFFVSSSHLQIGS